MEAETSSTYPKVGCRGVALTDPHLRLRSQNRPHHSGLPYRRLCLIYGAIPQKCGWGFADIDFTVIILRYYNQLQHRIVLKVIRHYVYTV